MDVDRTSEEGKASSVQFLHFNFSTELIEKFKKNDVILAIEHNFYNHSTKLLEDTRATLLNDFN